ncbi:MAG: ubiquinol-cytochrome c reductase iron-sulfur subunit [Candidatus Limnocylindrales bacterium]
MGTDPGTEPTGTEPTGTEPTGTEPTGTPTLSRRRVLRYLLGFSIVSTLSMVATPIIGFLVPPKTAGTAAGGRVLAGTTDDIPIGQGKVVSMGSTPVIVLDTATGVKAYSAICTHLGCIVAWDQTANVIHCPCHDGKFSPANGAVVSGPPPAPLTPIKVEEDGNKIYLVSS